jgi:hypothetical protein
LAVPARAGSPCYVKSFLKLKPETEPTPAG